jgi:hypothetical protein
LSATLTSHSYNICPAQELIPLGCIFTVFENYSRSYVTGFYFVL